MGGKKSARSQGKRGGEANQQRSARKHGTGGNSRQPPGLQLDEEARFSGFRVEGASNVNVGSTRFVQAPVIIITDQDLAFAIATRVTGRFPDLSYDSSGPDLSDILYCQASPLQPGSDYQDNSPCTRGRSTERPIGNRPRSTQNDMATSDTRHKTSIDSLSGHPENQHNAKILAERVQRHQPRTPHRAGDLTGNGPGQHERKIGLRERLRGHWRRFRGNKSGADLI
ncbi:hypothetical protein F4679DRAFT_205353 [Xylaria curta]|nr:hypothetical protein F4679DRAFT_205353 [Xylaria curta]